MGSKLCIYHSADLDGHCSGAIIKYKYPDAVMHPLDHGDEIDMNWVCDFDTVFICDFVLSPFSKMVELNKKVSLIWIDHHKTAIDAMKEDGDVFFGIQQNGIGACELTWKYLFPSEPVPRGVKLLAQYDVWDHSDLDTLPFQYGMKSIGDTHPIKDNMYKWNNVFFNDHKLFEKTCNAGDAVIAYRDLLNKRICEVQAFETVIDGYKAIACNRGLESSQMFETVWDKEKYDLMISFYLSKDMQWCISLYTNKEGIDVSVIAKKYGGGGHVQAAGCSVLILPFDVI